MLCGLCTLCVVFLSALFAILRNSQLKSDFCHNLAISMTLNLSDDNMELYLPVNYFLKKRCFGASLLILVNNHLFAFWGGPLWKFD